MRRRIPALISVLLVLGAAGLWLALRKPADTGMLVLNGSVDIRQVDLAFRVEDGWTSCWWRRATASPPVRWWR